MVFESVEYEPSRRPVTKNCSYVGEDRVGWKIVWHSNGVNKTDSTNWHSRYDKGEFSAQFEKSKYSPFLSMSAEGNIFFLLKKMAASAIRICILK